MDYLFGLTSQYTLTATPSFQPSIKSPSSNLFLRFNSIISGSNKVKSEYGKKGKIPTKRANLSLYNVVKWLKNSTGCRRQWRLSSCVVRSRGERPRGFQLKSRRRCQTTVAIGKRIRDTWSLRSWCEERTSQIPFIGITATLSAVIVIRVEFTAPVPLQRFIACFETNGTCGERWELFC